MMRLRLGCLLVLALAACHVETAPVGAPRATRAPAASAASHAPASALPATTHPGTGVTSTVVNQLQPAKGSTPLSGVLKIDASYLVAQGGGVISNDGSTLIANDGSSIIAHDGGTLISQDGSSIVAQGGGNVVASTEAGKARFSDTGGAIVAQGGGNIVAQGGGNIVAQGGGNAVTRSYRLKAATSAPAAGTILPAAGMLVSVVDLGSNQYLPLGTDANNQPVYAIYTNAKGGFQVYLPPSVKDNVCVVASAPGSTDDRLTYNLLEAPGSKGEPIDEDTALATRYMRRLLIQRLTTYLRQLVEHDAACPPVKSAGLGFVADVTGNFLDNLVAAIKSSGLATASDAERDRVISYAADYALARLDLKSVPLVVDAQPQASASGDAGAFAFVAKELVAVTRGAADKLNHDPGHAAFDADLKRMIDRINAGANSWKPGSCAFRQRTVDFETYKVRKPTDAGRFMVEALLGDGDSFRDRFAVEMLELTGVAPPVGAVMPLTNEVDDAIASAVVKSSDPLDAQRPAIDLYRRLTTNTDALVLQLIGLMTDHTVQCDIIHEVQPTASCDAASPGASP